MAHLLLGMQIAYRLFLLMLIEIIFRRLLFFFFELQADTSCQIVFFSRLPLPFFSFGFVTDRFVQSQCLPVNKVSGLPVACLVQLFEFLFMPVS